MGNILNKEQCDLIRKFRAEQAKLAGCEGWMTEGADDEMLAIFNNELEVSLMTDYFGNIRTVFDEEYKGPKPFEPSPELRQYIKLEGKIAQVAYLGKLVEE